MADSVATVLFLLALIAVSDAAKKSTRKEAKEETYEEPDDDSGFIGVLEGAVRSFFDRGCGTKCRSDFCDSAKINYGRYCGVGHNGCKGQKPCDAVDACCQGHDNCVTAKSWFDNECHATLVACLRKAKKSKKKGFSKKLNANYYENGETNGYSYSPGMKQCPYGRVIPAMEKAITAAVRAIEITEQIEG